MKRMWKKAKTSWDKQEIWGTFMMCAITVCLCMLGTIIGNIQTKRLNERNMEEILSTIATYLATATQDEYDGIAKTIRHDLVFSAYGRDMENLIQYIPNTSENCPTCQENSPAQALLVCLNTGEQYSLDLYRKDESPEEQSHETLLSFGYDEVSEARIHITKDPEAEAGCAEIDRERRIISAQRMKSVFCDDCIRELLNTIDGQPLEEVVLFDAEQKTFYPIEEGTAFQIGSYELVTSCRHGDFRIDIKSVGK